MGTLSLINKGAQCTPCSPYLSKYFIGSVEKNIFLGGGYGGGRGYGGRHNHQKDLLRMISEFFLNRRENNFCEQIIK